MKEAISREKDGHKAMCRNSTEENKRRCERRQYQERKMDTRQCVGIVLRRIRGGVKGGNIKREKWTQGNV